jgi:chemotaxis protein CheD
LNAPALATRTALAQRVIGIGELITSAEPGAVFITYALGSCVGVSMHDPVAGVGGLLHAMLPTSSLDPARACKSPGTYVDTGVAELIAQCGRLGAQKPRLVVTAAGGAALWDSANDQFQIGKRNVLALRQLLWKEGLMLRAHDLGGSHPRTMRFAVGSGGVVLTTYDPDSSRPVHRAVTPGEFPR